MGAPMKPIAIYGRVSKDDQTEANQLLALRARVVALGWQAVEFIDHAVSGAKTKRPALDAMLARVRAGEFAVVLAWKLDRIGRDAAHLMALRKELKRLGVGIVTLDEGIDTTKDGGVLMYGMRALFAEEERERNRERTLAGLARAKAQGKTLGRPQGAKDAAPRKPKRDPAAFERVAHLSVRKAAKKLKVHPNTVARFRRREKFSQPVDAIKIV
jgi:DNA invertase Pin-like site-specific DNA recombinase